MIFHFDGADPVWVERAQAVYDVLDGEAAAGDAAGALTPAAVEAIQECGVLRMALPRRFGGDEVEPVTAMRVYEELARADASAAWAAMAASTTTAWLSACLPDEGAEEVFGGPVPGTIAGMPQPLGKAKKVEGGYEFEGRFGFASGSRFANWWVGGAFVEGTEKPDGGYPDAVAVVVPESQVVRSGNWDVLGMRATESIDVVIGPCFVPFERTTPIPLPLPGQGIVWTDIRRETPVVRTGPIGVGTLGHGGVIIGLARRALEEIAVMAATRKPMGGTPIADRDLFRRDLVQNEVALRAIRALLYQLVSLAINGGKGPVDDNHLFPAVIHLHEVAYAAVEFAYRWGGTSVVRGSHPLGRAMRDMHAATQHVICEPQWLIAAATRVMADLTGDGVSGQPDQSANGDLAIASEAAAAAH